MGQKAAKKGDKISGADIHDTLAPGATNPVPLPYKFTVTLSDNLSENVFIDEKKAAFEGSVASDGASHNPPSGTISVAPANRAKITTGSKTVFINNKKAARHQDSADGCSNANKHNVAVEVTNSTVWIGG